ncbi:MAG: CcmD family protein [Caldilineaceae bacterium]
MVYLAAALIGVWLIVMLYVLYLGQRQGQLEQELRTLEELMSDSDRR